MDYEEMSKWDNSISKREAFAYECGITMESSMILPEQQNEQIKKLAKYYEIDENEALVLIQKLDQSFSERFNREFN